MKKNLSQILLSMVCLLALVASCSSDDHNENSSEVKACVDQGDVIPALSGNGYICTKQRHVSSFTHPSCLADCKGLCGKYSAGTGIAKLFNKVLPGGKAAVVACGVNALTNDSLCKAACYVPGYNECLEYRRRNEICTR